MLADMMDDKTPIEWVVIKAGGDKSIPITEAYSLTAMLTPTPRWPDAMCIIDPISKVVFTSKLFSAHVAPGLINSKVKFFSGSMTSHCCTVRQSTLSRTHGGSALFYCPCMSSHR